MAAAQSYKLGEDNQSQVSEDGVRATILEFAGGKETTLLAVMLGSGPRLSLKVRKNSPVQNSSALSATHY